MTSLQRHAVQSNGIFAQHLMKQAFDAGIRRRGPAGRVIGAIYTDTGRNLPVEAEACLQAYRQHGTGARRRRSAMLARMRLNTSLVTATSAIWKMA
jgi:hypothetical protein